MKLHHLTATFGCLNHAALELKDGLNIIEAPNESGKSTWLAFLRAMLYGLPGRERGLLAEKNRYAPWSGAAMNGRVELEHDGQELVLVRDTVQGGAPMGRFFAAYQGTADQIPGMTGQNAGEWLTGVPRAVFERSAFIRQSSLAIDQDSELEKRIASLLSSGEEDTSFTETEKQLRKALHQRRYHQSGALPQTEAEIESVSRRLAQVQSLQQELQADRTALRDAEDALEDSAKKLRLHARMDEIEAKRALFTARAEAEAARAEAEALQKAIGEEHLPPAEQLMQIKFNAANLLTTQVSMNHVQDQAEEAKVQTAKAQEAVDALCFAPSEPEAAAATVRSEMEHYQALQKHASPSLPVILLLTALALAGLGAGVMYAALPVYLLAAAAVIPVVLGWMRHSSRKKASAEAAALLTPYGVTSPEEIEPLLTHYNRVYQVLMEKKEAEAQINASWNNFYQTYKKLSSEILTQTASFCPNIENVHEISPLLDAGLRRWKQFRQANTQADQLTARCEALESTLPNDDPLTQEEESLARPSEDRSLLQKLHDESEERARTLRSRIDRAEGEAAAAGDRLELAARLETLESTRESVQEEYDALELALDAMQRANTELQTRFAPALGHRAGEIFSALTGGRYDTVLLDQKLNASIEDSEALPRDAALLSQGASDQLYLAVRLAICEQVLPAEKNTPLILDDTLTNFDEARMEAALNWLETEAKTRQILLFSCQRRESIYLQNHKNVHIISVSENRWR